MAAHTDLSVTGWNIQALKAAALTGISIDGLDEAMDKAVEYTKKCQDQSGKFAYKIGSGGKPSLTGTGVLCLQIWKNAKSEEAKKGLEWIVANQAKDWKSVNIYEWYYHAQACFQATGVSGDPDFGEHGTRISSRSYAEPKHPTGIGQVENTIMENPTFTIRR